MTPIHDTLARQHGLVRIPRPVGSLSPGPVGAGSAAHGEGAEAMSDRSHPQCWTGASYQHVCQKPSGRACVDCGAPAGTLWGPLWCPTCDVKRLDNVSVGFAQIAKEMQR